MARRGVAALALCLMAAACPAPSDTGRPPRTPTQTPTAAAHRSDATLRWSIPQLGAIVPMDATRPEDLLVVDALFDSLTAWDERLRPTPSAALRWSSSDNTVWRFRLRSNATFHDGTPVRAQDFVAAWTAQARDGAAHHHLRDVRGYAALRQGRSRRLNGVRAPDDHLLVVRLRRPVADFAAVVAHPALGPVPAERVGLRRSSDEPVGNGPFEMAEPWARGSFVRLTRIASARAPRGRDAGGRDVEEVIFRLQDTATGYLAFEQGRVDIATVPVGGLGAEDRTETAVPHVDGTVLRGRLPSTYLLGLNQSVEPFDDVAVRQAVSLALNREQIIADVFEGNASPGSTLVPPVIPGGRFRSCSACRYAPAAARDLFATAGVDALDLWISDEGDHDRVAAHVRGDLAAVGVDVRVRAVPFDRFQRAVRKGRAGLFRFGWTLDYPTLENALRPLFHSASADAATGANVFGYAARDVDALLDEAAATSDPQQRTDLFQRAEDLVLDRDQAVVAVVSLRRRTAVADRVEGLRYSPMGTADLRAVRLTDPAE